MKVKGVDLSAWNPINDYAAMEADGVNFAILKAIRQDLGKDKRFEEHYRGCIAAKIPMLGTYHYPYATTTRKAQESAHAWIDACENRFTNFYLDWEDNSLPTGQGAVDIINAYADVILSAGYEMDLYTGMYLYNTSLKKYADKLPYDIWIARYYNGYKEMPIAQEPNEKFLPQCGNIIGWQYTSSGAVKGASGRLDLDIWYGDILDNSQNKKAPIMFNPYKEPTQNVTRGEVGEFTLWVQWYCYQFGLFLDDDDKPDVKQMDGIFGEKTEAAVKEAQRRLGAISDGIVGRATRALFKKVC